MLSIREGPVAKARRHCITVGVTGGKHEKIEASGPNLFQLIMHIYYVHEDLGPNMGMYRW